MMDVYLRFSSDYGFEFDPGLLEIFAFEGTFSGDKNMLGSFTITVDGADGMTIGDVKRITEAEAYLQRTDLFTNPDTPQP